MASDPNVTKSRRKLATYGKSSHRELSDFDVPISPGHSDEDTNMSQSASARFAQTQKSSKATHVAGKPEKISVPQTIHKRTSNSSPRPSEPQKSVGSDLYDVPSSEDDLLAAASPLKPAQKRRKVPGNEGTLMPNSRSATTHVDAKQGVQTLLPHRRLVDKTIQEPLITSSKEQLSREVGYGSEVGKSNPGMRRPLNDKVPGARSEFGKRKTPHAEDEVRIPRQHSKDAASRDNSEVKPNLSAKNSQSTSNPISYPMSGSSSGQEGLVSRSEPQTPPPGHRRRGHLTSHIGEDSSQKSAFEFLSPSGLDFLSLEISGVPGHASPPKDSDSTAFGFAASVRKKLIDRLARRDGTSHSDLLGDQAALQMPDTGDCGDSEMVSGSRSGTLLAAQNLHSDELENPILQLDPTLTPHLTLGASPRHTYADRHRTLRKDESATEDDMLASIVDTQESSTSGTSRRIRDLTSKLSQDNPKDITDMGELDDEQSVSLRNIHELREAGASARLQGETEALLDEIESNNVSMRRNGLLSLINKLELTAFRDKFLASDALDSRLLRHIDLDMDQLSHVLFSMALLQCLAEQVSPQALNQYRERRIITFLDGLLCETASIKAISRNRKTNASKAFQQELENLCERFTKLPLWSLGIPTKLTPRTLSLHIIEHLTRHNHDTGVVAQIMSSSTMDQLSSILVESDSPPTPTEDNYLDFRATLSVLESVTLIHGDLGPKSSDQGAYRLLGTLSDLLISMEHWDVWQFAQTLALLFRLGLNLTNYNVGACSSFARTALLASVAQIVEQHFKKIAEDTEVSGRGTLVDNLVLSLGFLINLAEKSREARELFMTALSSSPSPLDTLLFLFTSKWVQAFEVTSEQESRESVPLGYLAVLLAFISIETSNRAYVESRLEGGSLKHLLIAVNAFLSYHRKVAEELQGIEGSDLKAHFVGRVQNVLDDLKETQA